MVRIIICFCVVIAGISTVGARTIRTGKVEASIHQTLPVVGETLPLPGFDGVVYEAEIRSKHVSDVGIVSYGGCLAGFSKNNVTVIKTGNGYVATVSGLSSNRILTFRFDGKNWFVTEEIPERGRRINPKCCIPRLPHGNNASKSVKAKPLTGNPVIDGARIMKNGETVTNVIDVLVGVDASAAEWIREKSKFSGMENAVAMFASDAIARCNNIYANTDLDKYFTFNLSGVVEIGYDCSRHTDEMGFVDSEYILSGLAEEARTSAELDKAFDDVREAREEVGADIVSFLVSCGNENPEGTVGIGYSLSGETIGDPDFADSAYNVCLIEAVAVDGTMAHEIGHNMGAGHAEMKDAGNSGPQLYEYSTGYYFDVTNSLGVFMHAGTVMAYDSNGYEAENRLDWGDPPEYAYDQNAWANGLYTEIPFFSSPNHTFRYVVGDEEIDTGIPLGDALHDNTRVLSLSYPLVANYRVRKSVLVLVDPSESARTLSGAGSYVSGSTVTLRANPKPGFVFAGWYASYSEATGEYSDPISCAQGGDYRDRTVKMIFDAEEDLRRFVYARFEPLAVDSVLGLMVDGVAVPDDDELRKSFVVNGTTNMLLEVESFSLPKIAVKGLPAGMKFTAKPIYGKGSKTEIETPANSVYGKPTKPGVYKVAVSVSNASIKKAVVFEFEIVVPNLVDDEIPVADEYGPFVPGVWHTVTIPKVLGCKPTGLPAGMKWADKDILDRNTQAVTPAGSVYGAPTKPGKYTVYFTKTVDRMKRTATATFVVGEFPVVKVAKIGGGTGKVTGAGAFAADKKVTLKATADKGSVFAGWYLGDGGTLPVESSVDYRTASLPYVMTAAPETTLYAMFVTQDEDSVIGLAINGNEITADANDNNFIANGKTVLPFELDSISIPNAAVKGLPAGMKFTARPVYKKDSKTDIDVPANTIYGAPTKPGLYKVSVSLTNTSVKKALVREFTIEVPNLTGANGYFVEDLDNGVGKKCVLSVGVSNIDEFLPDLKLNKNVKLAVKGLPAGLKYDAKSGKITGVATKAGTYTVYLTVTDGREKYVSTFTIEVETLPDWVVGTFEGYNLNVESDGFEWITITINSTGKCSYRWRTSEHSDIVDPKDLSLEKGDAGDYLLVVDESYDDWKCSSSIVIRTLDVDGVLTGYMDGESIGYENDGYGWSEVKMRIITRQNIWKAAKDTKLVPEFIKNTMTTVSMEEMREDEGDDCYGGFLTLKYGNDGKVTTAYGESEGGRATATGSAQLVPYEVDGDIVKAWLYTALKPRGRDSFGVLLFLTIDTSNGVVYGTDVMVEDYLLEVE